MDFKRKACALMAALASLFAVTFFVACNNNNNGDDAESSKVTYVGKFSINNITYGKMILDGDGNSGSVKMTCGADDRDGDYTYNKKANKNRALAGGNNYKLEFPGIKYLELEVSSDSTSVFISDGTKARAFGSGVLETVSSSDALLSKCTFFKSNRTGGKPIAISGDTLFYNLEGSTKDEVASYLAGQMQQLQNGQITSLNARSIELVAGSAEEGLFLVSTAFETYEKYAGIVSNGTLELYQINVGGNVGYPDVRAAMLSGDDAQKANYTTEENYTAAYTKL